MLPAQFGIAGLHGIPLPLVHTFAGCVMCSAGGMLMAIGYTVEISLSFDLMDARLMDKAGTF